MKFITRKFLAIAALTLIASTASAVPITGEIGFGGIWTPTGGTGTADATGIQINFAVVLAATGDMAPTTGQSVTYTPFTFDPFVPVAPLWSVTGTNGVDYSFDLDTVNVDFQSATELNLSGTGVLRADGFDDTFGTWNFSGNNQVLFTFSANAAPRLVPEPGALALFGLGFAGFVVARRRRNRA